MHLSPLVVACGMTVALMSAGLHGSRGGPGGLITAIAHVTMLQDLLAVPNTLNMLWTLSYEMARGRGAHAAPGPSAGSSERPKTTNGNTAVRSHVGRSPFVGDTRRPPAVWTEETPPFYEERGRCDASLDGRAVSARWNASENGSGYGCRFCACRWFA